MSGAEPAGSAAASPRAGESGSAIARNAFHLVLGQVATTALAVVLSAALGRSLGAQDFGVYFLVSTMSAFAYVLAEWGQPFFVIREAAQRPERAGVLLGTSLALRAAFAAAVAVPAGLLAWALGYGARTTWLCVLLIAASLPLFLAQGYGMIFRAADRMGWDAAVSVSNKAVVLALTLPALALGLGLPGVVAAQGAAGLAALGVALRLHRRSGFPAARGDRGAARELLRGGAPLVAMTLVNYLQPYLDAIILSQLAPPTSVGWYGAAKNLLGTLIAPATILGAAAYPRIARSSSDPAAFRRDVRGALRLLLWLGALAGAGTFAFADGVIALIYGAKGFGPAAVILQVFSPGFILLFVDVLLGNVLFAAGRGNGFTVAIVLKVAVATGLNVLLVPWFQERYGNGGLGIVVAFALSELVVFAGGVRCLPRGTLGRAVVLDILRAFGAGGATILLLRALPPLPLWAGIPACVAAFAGISLAVGLANRQDVELVRSLVRRRADGAAGGAGA